MGFMPQGTTHNLDAYVGTLRKLKARLKRVRPILEILYLRSCCNTIMAGLTPVSKLVKWSLLSNGQR